VGLLTWEQDSFAFAESHDEAAGRYRGLQFGRQVAVAEGDARGVLVKAEAVRAQLEAERAVTPPTPGHTTTAGNGTTATGGGPTPGVTPTDTPPPVAPQPRRFHGTVTLDPTRVGRDASRIADEVITHLAGLVGANVKVTLEIEAEVNGGVPEHVVRTVTENSRTLKFGSHGFEKE
jgi:hypothetical protein